MPLSLPNESTTFMVRSGAERNLTAGSGFAGPRRSTSSAEIGTHEEWAEEAMADGRTGANAPPLLGAARSVYVYLLDQPRLSRVRNL
jgi:hypothetical protein